MSGIKVSDEIKETYESCHNKKCPVGYAIFKFNDANDGLEVEKTGDRDATYEEYLTHFPKDEVRFGVFDMDFITPNEAKSSKVIAMGWFPQSAPVRQRMISASTFTQIKSFCSIGANEAHTVDNMADASYDSVLEKLGLGTRP